MTRKAKVKDDFTKDAPLKKAEQSKIKHDKMAEASGTFTDPDVKLSNFLTDINKLGELIEAVDAGDHSKITARDAAEVVLNDDLRKLAEYVNRIANGNETIIVLAGFTPTKTDITKAKIPLQGVLTGTPGKVIGSIKLTASKLEFAIRNTFIVGEDLSNVSMEEGVVIVTNSAKPIYIKTTKKNALTIANIDTRVNFQCMFFATSTVGSSEASEIIIVKSM